MERELKRALNRLKCHSPKAYCPGDNCEANNVYNTLVKEGFAETVLTNGKPHFKISKKTYTI